MQINIYETRDVLRIAACRKISEIGNAKIGECTYLQDEKVL